MCVLPAASRILPETAAASYRQCAKMGTSHKAEPRTPERPTPYD